MSPSVKGGFQKISHQHITRCSRQLFLSDFLFFFCLLTLQAHTANVENKHPAREEKMSPPAAEEKRQPAVSSAHIPATRSVPAVSHQVVNNYISPQTNPVRTEDEEDNDSDSDDASKDVFFLLKQTCRTRKCL